MHILSVSGPISDVRELGFTKIVNFWEFYGKFYMKVRGSIAFKFPISFFSKKKRKEYSKEEDEV